MAEAWQYIHAYHVGEGAERKWVTNAVGDVPDSVKNWRKGTVKTEDNG